MAASQVLTWSLAMVIGAVQGAMLGVDLIYTNANCTGTPVATKPGFTRFNACSGPHQDGNSQYYRKAEYNATHITLSVYSNNACTQAMSISGVSRQERQLATCYEDDTNAPATWVKYQTTDYPNTFAFTRYGAGNCSGSGTRFYDVPTGCATDEVNKNNGNLTFRSVQRTWTGTTLFARSFDTVDCSGSEVTSRGSNYTCNVCKNTTSSGDDSESGGIAGCPAAAATTGGATANSTTPSTVATTSAAAGYSAGPWTLASAVVAIAAGARVTAAGVN